MSPEPALLPPSTPDRLPTEAEASDYWINRAKTELPAYVLHCDPEYELGLFAAYLAAKLTDVARGRCKRLVITVPPRHGKTRLVITEWVTWLLGAPRDAASGIIWRSNLEVAYGSYSGERAEEESKRARDRVESPEYAELFPNTYVLRGYNRAEEWKVATGGLVRAVGVEGGLTGKGIDIGIIDDPVKDRAEAESPTMRDRVWDWYRSVFLTRLSKDAAQIIIMTRWHKDDLVGRILNPARQGELRAAMAAEGVDIDLSWEQVVLPALSEGDGDILKRPKGEALDPVRWPRATLIAKKAELSSGGNYEWNALYQQKPTNRGGNYIDTTKIQFVKASDVPKKLRKFRAYDLAASKSTSADYTVGILGGIHEDRLYILDVWRARLEWPAARQRIKLHAQLDRVTVVVETVAGFKAAGDDLRDVLGTICPVRFNTPDRDKFTRALPWIAMIATGRFFVVEGKAWLPDYLDELQQFPTGAKDDQVDATTILHEAASSSPELLVA